MNDIFAFNDEPREEIVITRYVDAVLVRPGMHQPERIKVATCDIDTYLYALALHKQEAIFISGGKTSDDLTNAVHRFCLNTYQLTNAPPMVQKRRWHSSTAVGDVLAVFGGWANDADLSDIEILNLAQEDQSW